VETKKEAPIEIGAVLIQYPMKNQLYDAGMFAFVANELLTVLINLNQQKINQHENHSPKA
jgi:hypothetical protein